MSTDGIKAMGGSLGQELGIIGACAENSDRA